MVINTELIVIAGERLTLKPLRQGSLEALCGIGLFDELWIWAPASVRSKEDMKKYISTAISNNEKGTELPFVITANSNGEVLGSTRFMNIDGANRKVEIGSTWITPGHQRTFVNTECKLLLLTHAFEAWQCIRVELKTDVLNAKSRRAILRLGAVEEGILRNNMITESGRRRDTVYYSILDTEWPRIKESLCIGLRTE